MVFNEFEAWKWKTKDNMEGQVMHICVDYDQNEESDDEENGEDTRVDVVA